MILLDISQYQNLDLIAALEQIDCAGRPLGAVGFTPERLRPV